MEIEKTLKEQVLVVLDLLIKGNGKASTSDVKMAIQQKWPNGVFSYKLIGETLRKLGIEFKNTTKTITADGDLADVFDSLYLEEDEPTGEIYRIDPPEVSIKTVGFIDLSKFDKPTRPASSKTVESMDYDLNVLDMQEAKLAEAYLTNFRDLFYVDCQCRKVLECDFKESIEKAGMKYDIDNINEILSKVGISFTTSEFFVKTNAASSINNLEQVLCDFKMYLNPEPEPETPVDEEIELDKATAWTFFKIVRAYIVTMSKSEFKPLEFISRELRFKEKLNLICEKDIKGTKSVPENLFLKTWISKLSRVYPKNITLDAELGVYIDDPKAILLDLKWAIKNTESISGWTNNYHKIVDQLGGAFNCRLIHETSENQGLVSIIVNRDVDIETVLCELTRYEFLVLSEDDTTSWYKDRIAAINKMDIDVENQRLKTLRDAYTV